MIEAGGSASQLLGIYYQGQVSGQAVQSTKDLGRGLTKTTLKDNTVIYRQNNQVITDPSAIEAAIAAENEFDLAQAKAEKQAQEEGKGAGKRTVELKATIEGLAQLVAKSQQLITAMYNHSGIDGATGAVSGGINNLALLPGDPITGSPREFATLHNQLVGTIFLNAFQSLKGGGQITEIEGEKATQAASNVDRKLNAPEYREAMVTFLQGLKTLQQQKLNEFQSLNTSELPSITPMSNFEPDF